MSQRLNNLNEIIATFESGAKFYRTSARKIGDDEIAKTFVEHAEIREEAARELAAIVDGAGGEPPEASAVETARAWYGKLMAAFGDSSDRLVAHLEEHEDRTLEVLRHAIRHKDNAEDKEMLRSLLERFESAHDRMRALKKAA